MYNIKSTLEYKVLVHHKDSILQRRLVMSQKISLKEAERKTFTSAYQDGLWDILIGCFILEFAIAPLLSRSLGDLKSSVVFLPFWAIVSLAIWLLRKYVVTPRVGVVKFGSWRRIRLFRFIVIILTVLVGASILGIIAAVNFATWPSWAPVACFSLIILVAFSIAAYLLDFTRLYIYGILFALSPLVGQWLYVQFKAPHHGFPITFGITAGTAILVGLVKFVHLLHDYPLPAEESPSKRAYGG